LRNPMANERGLESRLQPVSRDKSRTRPAMSNSRRLKPGLQTGCVDASTFGAGPSRFSQIGELLGQPAEGLLDVKEFAFKLRVVSLLNDGANLRAGRHS